MIKWIVLFVIGFVATFIYQVILNGNLPIQTRGIDIHLDLATIVIVVLLVSNLAAFLYIICNKKSS